MDSIAKFIKKLKNREREAIQHTIEIIISRSWKELDIKKLKGHTDIYRVRKGDIRIVFFDAKNSIRILSISRRDESTYKSY